MIPRFADADILCGEINGYGSPERGLPELWAVDPNSPQCPQDVTTRSIGSIRRGSRRAEAWWPVVTCDQAAVSPSPGPVQGNCFYEPPCFAPPLVWIEIQQLQLCFMGVFTGPHCGEMYIMCNCLKR